MCLNCSLTLTPTHVWTMTISPIVALTCALTPALTQTTLLLSLHPTDGHATHLSAGHLLPSPLLNRHRFPLLLPVHQ